MAGCVVRMRLRRAAGGYAWRTLFLLLLLAGFARRATALGDAQRVAFVPQPGAFAVADHGHVPPLLVDSNDWPGVALAVDSFRGDVQTVTGTPPAVLHTTPSSGSVVLIGTLGHSALIDNLVATRKLDVGKIRGQWEASLTQVVEHPFPGVDRALVIAGADKRGTIFGVYALSEQMGVSPWAWWADVRVPHHHAVYVPADAAVAPSPRVRYRGIFLNDEAPSLSGWTKEKFGGYNHLFYTKVFELLLRLRANYLWPAMWGSAFNEDDPADPALADRYGIVMGTSHHEPMLRAQQEWKRHGTGEWDYQTNSAVLDRFWAEGIRRNRDYESTVTIGMRGDGDMAMSATANTALLERIVADQRKIIAAEANPAVKNPQIWALYKEVQSYYEKGMRVPDDVTLLWCDDNWGNIRRLPTADERKRPGGAGIYYHFDYVGDPRNYKWLLTYNITKVYEQMHLAAEYGADRVWIVNVGDLKPMEFPIEFFLTMARNPGQFNPGNLQAYTEAWAAREFGPQHAHEIAELVSLYTQYNSRRKPEMLSPDTYSFLQDHEADRVEAEWKTLVARSQRVGAQLPADEQASYCELVGYPVEASATVGEMYIAAGRNHLYAQEGRLSANAAAAETRRLFAQDAALSDAYNHKLLNGKWDHMMDQTHIGYTTWQQPPANVMPAITEVKPSGAPSLGVFSEGSAQEGAPLRAFDAVNRQTRTIELAPRSTGAVAWTAEASAPWIHLGSTGGTAATDTPLTVSVDWNALPQQAVSTGHVTVRPATGAPVTVAVQAERPNIIPTGAVERDGMVSVAAEHFSANGPAGPNRWTLLPGFGETLSGMESSPTLGASTMPQAPQACLSYDFTLLHAGERTLDAVLAPTLPFQPGRGLRFAVSTDAGAPQIIDTWAAYTDAAWRQAVGDGVKHVPVPLGNLAAGAHRLHICRIDPAVVLERWVIYAGHSPETYLGPPESLPSQSPRS